MTGNQKVLREQIIEALRVFVQSSSWEEIEETAVPSYVHSNYLVRSIFWGRIYAVVNSVSSVASSSVLDFGCGSGIVTAHLSASLDRNVFDIDYRPFEFLRKHLPALQDVHQLHSSELSEMESRFDAILAADVLEHFEIDKLASQIQLFHKWLKPGGKLIISGPTENLWYKIGRRIAGYDGHYHKMNVSDIERAVEESKLFKPLRKLRYPIPFVLEGFLVLTFEAVR